MLNLRAAKKSTDGKTLKFRAAKLKGFTVCEKEVKMN